MRPLDFEKSLWLSSVQLVRVDEDIPDRFASGTLVDYGGKRVLLTVQHATGQPGRWAIQLGYVPGVGTQLYALDAMNFLARVSLLSPTADPQDIDFSYVEVPANLVAFRQEIDLITNEVQGGAAITVHTPNFLSTPQKGDTYGFSGTVRSAPDDSISELHVKREFRTFPCLSFVGTEQDYYYFSLAGPFPGHEHFKGCSGAPILNDTGALVALLCGWDTRRNELFGISLRAYKTPIDILVGKIG